MKRDIPDPVWLPDPPQDRRGGAVTEFAVLVHAVSVPLGYGRHLLATVQHRAVAVTFPIIAACFGTPGLSTILAHLNRGILCTTALERALLARAATGRDINIVSSRTRTDEPPPAPGDTQAKQPADQPATHKASRRTSLRKGWNELLEFMHYIVDGIATVMREKSHREQAFVSEQYELAGARMLAFSNNAQLALRRGYSPSYERLYHEP